MLNIRASRSRKATLSFSSTWSSTDSSGTLWGSSSSTIWGPGAVAGKGIKALGEATLRGVESVIIRRKLAAIDVFFPQSTCVDDERSERLHDEVLELSRVNFYKPSIRRRAMRAIIMQINRGYHQLLIRSLQRWPTIELQLFASELLSFTTDAQGHTIQSRLLDHTSSDERTRNMFIFISTLASFSPSLHECIVDLGLYAMAFAGIESILSSLDPNETGDKDDQLQQAYDDLLEFSRTDKYPPQVHGRAMCLIIGQIRTRHTTYLQASIMECQPSEVHAFVSHMLKWSSSASPHAPSLTDLLLSKRPPPVIFLFLCRVAILFPSVFEILFETGFLDTVMRFVVLPEYPLDGQADIFAACNTILQTACESSSSIGREVKSILSRHPISQLWPTQYPSFLRSAEIDGQPPWQRQLAWRTLSPADLLWRVQSIDRRTGVFRPFNLGSAMDVCVDLMAALECTRLALGFEDGSLANEARMLMRKLMRQDKVFMVAFCLCWVDAVPIPGLCVSPTGGAVCAHMHNMDRKDEIWSDYRGVRKVDRTCLCLSDYRRTRPTIPNTICLETKANS